MKPRTRPRFLPETWKIPIAKVKQLKQKKRVSLLMDRKMDYACIYIRIHKKIYTYIYIYIYIIINICNNNFLDLLRSNPINRLVYRKHENDNI